MATIIERLQNEHRTLRKVLDSYRQSPRDKYMELRDLVENHTKVEENVLYPAGEEFAPEVVEHSREEHAKADELLASLGRDVTNMGLFVKLKEALEHHVVEEEKPDGFFDLAKRNLDDATLREMNEQADVEAPQESQDDEVQGDSEESSEEPVEAADGEDGQENSEDNAEVPVVQAESVTEPVFTEDAEKNSDADSSEVGVINPTEQ